MATKVLKINRKKERGCLYLQNSLVFIRLLSMFLQNYTLIINVGM